MKKLLDSDWLGLMQFSGDSKQKMVNSVQRSNKLDILIGQQSKSSQIANQMRALDVATFGHAENYEQTIASNTAPEKQL